MHAHARVRCTTPIWSRAPGVGVSKSVSVPPVAFATCVRACVVRAGCVHANDMPTAHQPPATADPYRNTIASTHACPPARMHACTHILRLSTDRAPQSFDGGIARTPAGTAMCVRVHACACMCLRVHACTCTCACAFCLRVQVRARARVHALVRARVRECMCTCGHARLHASALAYMRACVRACMRTCELQAQRHACQVHASTHACSCTHAQARTPLSHTHAHAFSPAHTHSRGCGTELTLEASL